MAAAQCAEAIAPKGPIALCADTGMLKMSARSAIFFDSSNPPDFGMSICTIFFAPLMDNERHKATAHVEILAGKDGHGRFFGELDPGFREVGIHGILKPHRLHGSDCARQVKRIRRVQLPVAVDCDFEAVPKGLAHIGEALGVDFQIVQAQLAAVKTGVRGEKDRRDHPARRI